MRHASHKPSLLQRPRMVVLACVLAGASGAVADLNDGLVGYWSFDEGEGDTAHDYSGYDNHGTIFNATWVNGISGSALEFDGVDNRVEVPDAPVLNPGSVTVGLWFKGRVIPGDWNYAYLLSKWQWHPHPDGSGYRIHVADVEGQQIIRCMIGLHDGTYYATSWLPYQEDAWQHVAGAYDSVTGTIALYLNGELKLTATIPAQGIPSTSGPLTIDAFLYFQGRIDEVRVYSRVLSHDEVLDLYWSTTHPDPQEDTTEGEQGEVSGTSSDPVNTATGSFFHQETDLTIPSRGLPLTFTRYYNSKSAGSAAKSAKSKQMPPGRKTATSQPAGTKQGKRSRVDAKNPDESPGDEDQKQAAGSSQALSKIKEENR